MKFRVQYVRCVNGGSGGRAAGGRAAHRVTHKIVKKWMSFESHHIKSTNARGFILHTHCNEQ